MASRIPSRTTALLALVLCLSAAAFGQGPSIWTDFPDYAPGSTVNITGSGFVAGESVSLLVLHVNGNNGGNGHLPWTAAAGRQRQPELDLVRRSRRLVRRDVHPHRGLGLEPPRRDDVHRPHQGRLPPGREQRLDGQLPAGRPAPSATCTG